MAKKKKRRIQAPSLSPLDKGIYYLLIGCSGVAGFFLFPVIVGQFRLSVFEDKSVLAQNNPAIVILGFLGLFLGFGLMVLFDWLRRKKQPIFGKTGIAYGPPKWKPTYPLFSRAFWRSARTNKKRSIPVIAALVLATLAIVLIILLGLSPRECLHDDGSVSVYNCFNEKSAEYGRSDVAKLHISTRYHQGRGANYWGLEMKISMNDGKDFSFSNRDFQTLDDNVRGSIAGMHQIKSYFDPGIVTLEGTKDLQDVIRSMELNPREIEMLYSLFAVEAPPAEK